MVQGLQGGQDVLIVPHVVHEVIWGGQKKGGGKGVLAPTNPTGACLLVPPRPSTPYPVPPYPVPPCAPTTQLLGVHVAAERGDRVADLSLSPLYRSACCLLPRPMPSSF